MAHDHAHHQSGNNLKVAFFLNLGFTVLEIIGGFFVNSISILSDALHDLGDSLSLGISWYLNERAKKEANKKFTFGYSRFSLLGALINSLVLIGGSIFVISQAIGRIIAPEPANAQGMIVFAIIGIAVNGYAAYKLSGGKTLNEKVVSWHLLEDVLGWVAVLIVAIVMLFAPIWYLDPALSLAITAYVLFNVLKRLKETLEIFLQGTPKDIDTDKIVHEITAIENISTLHHTHIWSLEGEHHVFTTHIKLQYINSFQQILSIKNKVKAILKQYPFTHYTIEVELDEETCELATPNGKEEHT